MANSMETGSKVENWLPWRTWFSHVMSVGCGRQVALQMPRRQRLRVEERDFNCLGPSSEAAHRAIPPTFAFTRLVVGTLN